MTHQKKPTLLHHKEKKTALLYFILYNQAVLLICDHELGLNLANSQINSAKLPRKWKTSILINACVILLVISTISLMLLLLIFSKAAPWRKKGGKGPSLYSYHPPPRLFFFFFFLAREEKPQSKEKNPNPNNQMSLDKQLINVFSSPSTWEKSFSLKRSQAPLPP